MVQRLDRTRRRRTPSRLTVDLPANFALNQPLSTFALAAIELLDPESDTYALDVLSVIEATLENPRQILSAQQHKARGEAVAQMKAEGIEYDERMELLEEITYPKPLAELLEAAFAMYCKGHPWLLGHQLSPKSVVRDLWERAMTFGEYVSFYGLNRSEGLVLRYLSDAYRALRAGVPAAPHRGGEDLTSWLGELVHQVDSSLLDEWEQLTSPQPLPAAHRSRRDPAADRERPSVHGAGPQCPVPPGGTGRPAPLLRTRRARPADGWDADAWQDALSGYFAEYDRIGIGAAARGPDCSW